MIFVGSRDGQKGLGLGFGGGGEMEEFELEEGEACYYQDDDANINPDVDLSYIDEKVQDVLGHFQKDFEGGVSAENLGAKFGCYGSFLPTYQRSPSIWSHPRTPPKVQGYNTPKSPNILPSEGARPNSTVRSIANPSAGFGPASKSAAPQHVSRAPFVENSSKRDMYLSSARGTGEFTPKHEPVNKSISSTDHKTLKVRIKVGSDNMAQTNAAIYSGLGLDISPSSSLEDSPVESGGLSPESQDSPDESPTSILHVMTSFPIPEAYLLSPLSDNLLHLTEKEKLSRDSRPGLACKSSQESASILVNGSSLVRGKGKVCVEKKMESVEKNIRLMEAKHGIGKDAGNEASAHLREEIDIVSPAGRELVSNSPKLPLLSNSKCTIGDTSKVTVRAPKVSMETHKVVLKDKFLSSELAKEETFDSVASQDANRDEKLNSKVSSADKVWEDRKASCHKDVQFVPRKDGRCKGDTSNDLFKADFSVSMGSKGLNGALIDPPKDMVSMKAKSSHGKDGAIHNGKEQPSSGGKKKSKGSRNNTNPVAEFPKESLRVSSSAASKDKKKSTGDYPSKNKLDDSRLAKESSKTRESHRDSFGDVKMEHAENYLETPSKTRSKNSKLEVVEKETHQFAEKSKERSSGKNVDSMSGAYTEATQIFAPPSTGSGLLCDVVPATGAPVVIEENWVCCDRCQKWRLLPFGTNPDHLPKKWLCSMLNWLPGMNHCNISEEETTKALNALYQVPVPEAQNNLQSQTDGAASGVALTEVCHLDQMQQDHNLHAMPSQGKKKHGSKETSNVASSMGLVQFSNSTKNNIQASMKSRRLNEVYPFPLESNSANKASFQHSSKSSDPAVEKHKNKQKEKHKLVPDGGDAKHLKMKSKREADQDGLRASKKIKTGGLYYADGWNSDHGGIMGKVCPSLSNGFPSGATGKDAQKYGEYSSSKDSKCDAKDSLSSSRKKPKDPVQVSLDDQAFHIGKCDPRDIIAKKRKVKEWQESQIYPPETHPNAGHHLEVNRVSLEEATSESQCRKVKKARLSQSEGKESSTSKGDSKADTRGRGTEVLDSSTRDSVANRMEEGKVCIEKDQELRQYRGGSILPQRMLDGIDSLKRDLGYGQPYMAATSSSSKVSGSRISKANFQEVKGSPVESVSSSPLRISNPDKVTSARRILLSKDDATNVGFSVMSGPRKCSDGEGDGGSDQSETVRKEKASSVFHRGSLESSIDYQDKDANRTSGGKAKASTEPSYKSNNSHLNGGSNILDHHNQYQELLHKEHGHNEERVNNHHYHSNGSLPRKSGKGSSSRAKDKQRSSKSDIDKGKIRVDSFNGQGGLYPMKKPTNEAEIESRDRSPHPEESRDVKHCSQNKCGGKSGNDENNYSGKKDSTGKWPSEGRIENQSKFGGHDVSDLKLGATCGKDGKSNPQQDLLQDHDGERSSNRFRSDRSDLFETTSGRVNSQLLPHSRDKQETKTRCPRPISGAHKGSGLDVFPVEASGGGDALKVTKHPLKPDNQDGAHHSSLRHSTPNGLVVSDLAAPSPVRKDSSNQAAANALKEAKGLKHSADRLKNSGLDLERTGLYFQAVLKFLHGASLLELCNVESSKHGETQSMQVYSETASLCEFVAHEYERCKEMAAAALAYKCMEVAYMRVVYSKNSNASKDRHELQAALQMVPPGESSSSSASDVDNLNNQGMDKVALGKNRPNFMRLLNFAWDANLAMEASRKSQNAFAAAIASLEEAKYGDGLPSVRRVLNFNFNDVQGLLHLVRLAMEAIGH